MSTTVIPAALSALDVEEFGRADGPVLLLGDVTVAHRDRAVKLFVDSAHGSRERALAAITADGVNPLPRLLADLDAGELIVIDYHPVTGMTLGAVFDLHEPVDVEDLRDELGHKDR